MVTLLPCANKRKERKKERISYCNLLSLHTITSSVGCSPPGSARLISPCALLLSLSRQVRFLILSLSFLFLTYYIIFFKIYLFLNYN